MPPTSQSGLAAQPPEKKKRRQNVACDSCRLRRVKCDMLALLTPADSTRVMPPLPVLVRQNPDVSCSNCISKGIRCTTNQIVNPSKPNKGGKRIEEAKKMFGGEGAVYPSSSAPASGSASVASQTPALAFPPHPTRQTSQTTTESSASSSSFDLSDPNSVPTTVNLNSNGFLPSYGANQYAYPGTGLLDQTAPAELPTWTTEWASNAVSTPYGTPFELGLYSDMSGTASDPSVWDSFVFPPTPQAPYPSSEQSSYSAPSLYPSSAASQQPNLSSSLPTTFEGAPNVASPSQFPSIMLEDTYDSQPDASFNRQSLSGSSSSGSVSPAPPQQSGLDLTSLNAPYHPSLTSFSPGSASPPANPPQIVGKKRQHTDDDIIEIMRSDEERDKDPWSIWSDPSMDKDNKRDKVVRWSRSDNVGDSLASRALGSELSRHLVRIYFSSVQLTLPAISPEAFYMSWQQAGERSDRMGPAQEVLCAVIEAWAARFSDHPVVLGTDPNKRSRSPKLILEGGSETGRGSVHIDQSNYGQLRLRVCVALVERARRLMDKNGILRKPSVTGVQALALFTQLQHMTDYNPSASAASETEMYHSTLVKQLRELDLTWASEGNLAIYKAGGLPPSIGQLAKQRRIFWTVLIADSFWAAGTSSEPLIPDIDIEASGAWLRGLRDVAVPTPFYAVSFFMNSWYRIAILVRKVARTMSIPILRPGRIGVFEFCDTARTIWRGVQEVYHEINSHTEELLSCSRGDILGFSPVHQFSSLRLSTSYLLLIMQQLIQQLLHFRRRLHEAYIHDDMLPAQARPETARVAALEELHSESIDILLANVRAQVPLFESLMPTGLIQGGSMLIRVLLASAQFLAEVPTNEQGYPNNTRGGVDWTWDNKQAEVGCCIKALHQLGWAWADVSPCIKQVNEAMQRLTPSPESLLSYAFNAQNIDSEVDHQAAMRRRELARDANAAEHVFRFWPPPCVPDVVSRWSVEQRAAKQIEGIVSSNGVFEHTFVERPSIVSMDEASMNLAEALSQQGGHQRKSIPHPPEAWPMQPNAFGQGPGASTSKQYGSNHTVPASWTVPPQPTQGDSSHLASELESFLESIGYDMGEGVPS